MGAVISAVEAGSPADHAGLLTGDILLALDGTPITGADDLVRLLDAEKIDRTIPFDILRRSDQRRFWAALRERNQFSLPAAPPSRNSRNTIALLRAISFAA